MYYKVLRFSEVEGEMILLSQESSPKERLSIGYRGLGKVNTGREIRDRNLQKASTVFTVITLYSKPQGSHQRLL